MYDPTIYPQPSAPESNFMGVYPADFLLEQVIDRGIEWFRTTPEAPMLVYQQLMRPELVERYGQEKIDEITKYIIDTDIRVIQSFPIDDKQSPSISVNMNSSGETQELGGLDRFAARIVDLDSMQNVIGGHELGYHPITDSLLVGIHATGSADKVKYLYYLVLYIMMTLRSQLEESGLFNMTFQATDLSRLNEYLPANMFSRFLTINLTSMALYKKGDAPVITGINLNINVNP